MEPQNAIYDARQLGLPHMMILGVQHLFAMFGATVLVPLLTGLDVSITLLFAGIGTLMFHFISKWNVPAFLGSSFAFLGGYASVKEMGVAQGLSETLALDYACLGVACAGLMYFVMAALIKSFGVKKILHYFPPVVTGPIVIAIGLVLSGSAINNCQTNWLLAIIAIVTVIVSSVWGKGIIKIIPVLLGVIVSYVIAACMGEVDFAPLGEAAWVGFPIEKERTIWAVFEHGNTSLMLSVRTRSAPHIDGRRCCDSYCLRLWSTCQYHIRREYGCAESDQGIRPESDTHCRLPGYHTGILS